VAPPAVRPRTAHPVGYLLGQRTALGVFTFFVVSVLVFLATQVLPGNAAIAVLGRTAAGNPAAVHRLLLLALLPGCKRRHQGSLADRA